MRKVILIFAVVFLLLGCSDGSSDAETKNTQASKKQEYIVNSPSTLPLDQATTSDIVSYMGRSADKMRSGSGDNRELVWKLDDGSEIIFVMKPKQGGGLVLDYIDTE